MNIMVGQAFLPVPDMQKMIIRVRIAGIIDCIPVHAEGDVKLKDGATLKKFFKEADKQMGFKKEKYFKKILKQGVEPTILLNGDRIDLPEGFKQILSDGDDMSVVLPMAGG